MDMPEIFQWGEIAGDISSRNSSVGCIERGVRHLILSTPMQNSARRGAKTTPLTIPTSARTSFSCPKCGSTNKSGKRSCCAPGGAWFKKCGDVGDTNFDHTWAEGIKACKSKL